MAASQGGMPPRSSAPTARVHTEVAMNTLTPNTSPMPPPCSVMPVKSHLSCWRSAGSALACAVASKGITVSQRKMPMQRASAESAPNAATVAASG